MATPLPRLSTYGNQFVDPTGKPVRLRGVNLSGAEGNNFAPHALWKRPWRSQLDEIAEWGFNCIRFPFSGDFCAAGRRVCESAINGTLNQDIKGLSALEFLDKIVHYCDSKRLYLVLDHHRKHRGAGQDDGKPYDDIYCEQQWHANWRMLAERYGKCHVVVGADLHNEPHALEWCDWKPMVERCAEEILGVAPDWLMFVEGNMSHDGDPYWDGGQFLGARNRLIELSKPGHVVYAPHDYGQSVAEYNRCHHNVPPPSWLALDEKIPADWPKNLRHVWRKHWGWIFEEKIAPVFLGEFGGHFGYNDCTGQCQGSANASYEREWLHELCAYLNDPLDTGGKSEGKEGISFAYWNYMLSDDTGSLLTKDLETPQRGKLELLKSILST